VGGRRAHASNPLGFTTGLWVLTWAFQVMPLFFYVVSPLWFMCVYLMLVLVLPVAIRLHARFDTIVLVTLAGIAGLVDVFRFRYDVAELGWINMIVVWGLCHQLGFFCERIVTSRRTVDWTLLIGGGLALAALVSRGLYPGSMVGVPGETSNMAPPTVCIIALVLFQAGILEIIRPAIPATP
jgi:hypothetical protein